MPDEPQHYGGTVSPLIVKDMVIAGVSGGDWGIRGFLAAYKASTGERVWRHWTVPASGEPGFDTWKGKAVTYGGGATWLTGSYDPETDTLYWATGNPYPDSDDRERGGDNLFTNCVLALNPDTGEVEVVLPVHSARCSRLGCEHSPTFWSTRNITARIENCFCMRIETDFFTSSIAPKANFC